LIIFDWILKKEKNHQVESEVYKWRKYRKCQNFCLKFSKAEPYKSNMYLQMVSAVL